MLSVMTNVFCDMAIQNWPFFFLILLSFVVIPPSRPESGDHSLWTDEEEVQSVQRDQKTSQPPNVRKLFYLLFHFYISVNCTVAEVHNLQSSNNKSIVT